MAFWIPLAISGAATLAIEGIAWAIDYFSDKDEDARVEETPEDNDPEEDAVIEQLKKDLDLVEQEPQAVEVLREYYHINPAQLNQMRQAIAEDEENLTKANIRLGQANERKNRALEGLAVQSTGGQRKHLKDAVAQYRSDEKSLNQDIAALTTGIAKKTANYDALADLSGREVTDANTAYSKLLQKQTGVSITSQLQKPGTVKATDANNLITNKEGN